MKSLTWNQVNAWRLAQHGLASKVKREDFIKMTSRLFGIHAQVMSAAELGLGGVRVDGLMPGDVQAALWEERTLVKTWAMRGTLHLLTADDLPLHAAARSIDPRGWIDFEAHGISPKQAGAFFEAVPEILGSEPMTREQLASAVAEQVGLPVLGELIAKSKWGSPLKTFAFRGELCFGPNEGQKV
ncbi:MAG: winged helix DNA-binding domain-containing protein, partial [Anaerolineaceae bacterium]|nr:winged helix DNA-binding domain-containing protein [Anaerolineaceae bacterium]